jgi:hypothetical protein
MHVLEREEEHVNLRHGMAMCTAPCLKDWGKLRKKDVPQITHICIVLGG